MASILDVSISSDSEDDVDYVPPAGAASDSSGDEVEEAEFSDSETKTNGSKTKRSTVKEKLKSECEEKVPEVEKKKADDIWKTFMSEVGMDSTKQPIASSKTHPVEPKSVVETPPKDAEKNASEKPTPISVFEYAGETFVIGEDTCNPGPHGSVLEGQNVAATSKTKLDALPKKRGLASVLGTLLNKKQKMTTLQKTLYDWKTFKKSEGLQEELETYNKGKGGYVERQRFLQRSDLRSFENEKNVRLSKKKE